MPSLQKQWIIPNKINPIADSRLNKYHPVLRQILFNRGIDSEEAAENFCHPTLAPPEQAFDLLSMKEAVDRINWGIKHEEKIAIYGDYDADGVTATALLTDALERMGASVFGYIPNRFEEGYGLNRDAIETLCSNGTGLVITVDCGIRSPEEVDYAGKLGMDMIISDHHQPGGELPEAYAIINPRRSGDYYPYKELAGVGLAYKIVSAINRNHEGIFSEDEYLDLVAIGTIADLAPLTGENRALVKSGLDQIRAATRQSILSLVGAAGLTPENIDASTIGFVLGPRLNAAGRLETAYTSLELLLSSDVNDTGVLAQKLENQNRERQKITKDIQNQAEQVIGDPADFLIIAVHPEWNPGVVGLVASRLAEKFYRPSIVASQGSHFTRGSCRSIPEFNITKALDTCAELLEHHGGHSAAAGFTIKNEKIPELIERLKIITRQELGNLDLRPFLYVDEEIKLHDLKPELIDHLNLLQPTGRGNPSALFASYDLKIIRSSLVGRKEKPSPEEEKQSANEDQHLRLVVTDGRITYDCIAFRQGHWHQNLPKFIDMVYTFEINEFNGRKQLQLNVKDIRPSFH